MWTGSAGFFSFYLGIYDLSKLQKDLFRFIVLSPFTTFNLSIVEFPPSSSQHTPIYKKTILGSKRPLSGIIFFFRFLLRLSENNHSRVMFIAKFGFLSTPSRTRVSPASDAHGHMLRWVCVRFRWVKNVTREPTNERRRLHKIHIFSIK